jgi:uncharacterized protein YukE
VADLEPLLPYDSSALRALSGDLSQDAQALGTAGSDVSAAWSSMVFEGPAGDRVHSGLTATAKGLTDAAQRLQGAAAALASAADWVDEQNAAIERHNREVLAHMPALERKLVLENS